MTPDSLQSEHTLKVFVLVFAQDAAFIPISTHF